MKRKKLNLFIMIILLNTVNIFADDGWQITVTSKDNYNGVTLANGRIGIVSGKNLFSVTDIVLNGVFDKESLNGVSRIVRGPVFTNINFHIDGEAVLEKDITGWKQTLNMKEALLTTSVDFKNKAHIDYTILALRQLPYMGMVVVEITPYADIRLEVENEVHYPAELKNETGIFKTLKDAEILLPVFTSQAQTRTDMHTVASSATFLFDEQRPVIEANYNIGRHKQSMKFEKVLKRNQKYRFALAGSACSTRDFKNPVDEAERMAVYAVQNKIDFFLDGHKQAWDELWQGDIEIEGKISLR